MWSDQQRAGHLACLPSPSLLWVKQAYGLFLATTYRSRCPIRSPCSAKVVESTSHPHLTLPCWLKFTPFQYHHQTKFWPDSEAFLDHWQSNPGAHCVVSFHYELHLYQSTIFSLIMFFYFFHYLRVYSSHQRRQQIQRKRRRWMTCTRSA